MIEFIFIMTVLTINIISGIIASNMANAKGYKSSMGAVYGLILGLIGVIIVGLYPNKKDNSVYESSSSDKYDKLEKLQELKSKGVLTEEEFNIEKRKIMKITP